MTWAKFDDASLDHPKVLAAGPLGTLLWFRAILWSCRHLTDGYLSPEIVARLGYLPEIPDAPTPEVLAQQLVTVGLWEPDPAGWRIHDFLAYQPSRRDGKRARDSMLDRLSLRRDPDVCRAVKRRDGSRCRYCAVRVNWHDRRGPRGATYDHVVPGAGNTLDNVVVSCLRCNSAKGLRTPEEAGMALLEPKSASRLNLAEIQPSRPVPSRPRSRSQKAPPPVGPPPPKDRIRFDPATGRLTGIEPQDRDAWGRAYPGVDLGLAIADAEDYLRDHHGKYRDLAAFLRGQFRRAPRSVASALRVAADTRAPGISRPVESVGTILQQLGGDSR